MRTFGFFLFLTILHLPLAGADDSPRAADLAARLPKLVYNFTFHGELHEVHLGMSSGQEIIDFMVEKNISRKKCKTALFEKMRFLMLEQGLKDSRHSFDTLTPEDRANDTLRNHYEWTLRAYQAGYEKAVGQPLTQGRCSDNDIRTINALTIKDNEVAGESVYKIDHSFSFYTINLPEESSVSDSSVSPGAQ